MLSDDERSKTLREVPRQPSSTTRTSPVTSGDSKTISVSEQVECVNASLECGQAVEAVMTDGAESIPSTEDGSNLFSICQVAADHAVILSVAGELDLATAPILSEQLRAAVAVVVPPAPVVLDLSRVTFLASVGLSILVEYNQRCARSGSELRVVATGRHVLRPIEITGLDDTITVVDTVDEALHA